MKSKLTHLLRAVAIAAIAGALPNGSALAADDLSQNSLNSLLPPQTLPQGF